MAQPLTPMVDRTITQSEGHMALGKQKDEQKDQKKDEQPVGREDAQREEARNPTDLPKPDKAADLSSPLFMGKAEGGHVPAPVLQVVTNATVRGDNAALTGHFCDVVAGEHAGRYGVLDSIATVDDDGNPLTGIVFTRDDAGERIVVKYEDCRPAQSGRR